MSRDDGICIIGGGAVGGVLAYFLYRSGIKHIPVYYASEESYKEVKNQGGVYVYDKKLNEEFLVPVVPRHHETPIDRCFFVFNAVKAYDVPGSLRLTQKIAIREGLVIMLQNGFGSLELAEESIHGTKVAGGVVYYGAERAKRGRVIYHGGNVMLVGCRKALCLELLELTRVFRLGGLDFRVVSDIDYYRWLKLALNAVVNPMTAVLRARNKVILEEEGLELARLILREVCEAAKLQGYELDEERLLAYVKRNVEAVADNISSMAQDVVHGKTTEVDYINGYVARTLGKGTSVNHTLTLLVKLAEKARNALIE
ncbi:MAG: 2-dehydropantoate 2-reductase [Desulfurococcaceae archaeon]